MKIYIENYNIENLSKKMKGLNKYLTNDDHGIMHYSQKAIATIQKHRLKY